MITSTGNSRIRNVAALRKKPGERKKQDAFLVEGIRMFQEIPRDMLMETFVSESFLRTEGKTGILQGIPYETVTEPVFAYMSDTKTPQGIIGIVRRQHYGPGDLLGKRTTTERTMSGRTTAERTAARRTAAGGTVDERNMPERTTAGWNKKESFWNPLILVLENLQDPGNLGTILRTAEGAGVTGVLMSEGCVDIYNPKVIRSTMGSVFRMPFCYTADLQGVLTEWKKRGIRIFAAHLHGENSFTQESYQEGSAFLIGNESQGLTEETAQLADCLIRIPMRGKVESLNASVAASLLVYEAMRQRETYFAHGCKRE